MQLAIVAAGFSPGEADHLRRSMAAWRRRGGLEKFEQRLIDGMAARGFSEDFARQIYQQILGFGEYGFPESHSASFALLVYVSAWLKCYEPAAFCAALVNSQPMGFYAPAQLVQDARRHGVDVRPVDVTVERVGLHAGEIGVRATFSRAPAASESSAETCDLTPFAGAAPRPAPRRRADRSGRESGSSRHGTPHRLRAWPISPTARSSTAAISPVWATRARSRRWPAIATPRCGTSPASSGCRRSSPAAPSTRMPRRCRHRPRGRTSSPTTGRSASRCAAIRWRCCATGSSDGGSARRPTSARRRMAASCAPPASSSAASGRTPRAASSSSRWRMKPGPINVIVWRDLGDRQRRELLGAKLLAVYGKVEREGQVVHVLAGRLADLSPLLGELPRPLAGFPLSRRAARP